MLYKNRNRLNKKVPRICVMIQPYQESRFSKNLEGCLEVGI